jgi:hypothetical protein
MSLTGSDNRLMRASTPDPEYLASNHPPGSPAAPGGAFPLLTTHNDPASSTETSRNGRAGFSEVSSTSGATLVSPSSETLRVPPSARINATAVSSGNQHGCSLVLVCPHATMFKAAADARASDGNARGSIALHGSG